ANVQIRKHRSSFGNGMAGTDTQAVLEREDTLSKYSRRTFLKQTGQSTIAAALAGVPLGWAGGAYPDDSPETPNVRFGIIALTDCSSIVMAHELGYFKKFAINSVVSKEPSWTTIQETMKLREHQSSNMCIDTRCT